MALRKLTTSWFAVMALIAAAVIGLTGTASASAATTGTDQDFAAQARQAGLTGTQAKELQTRVTGYLTSVGGKQVSANKIALAGKGEIVVAVPGERHARDLTSTAAKPGTKAACPYENFCMWTGTNFTGTQFNLWKCQTYDLANWNDPGSWSNNQTPGTRARFLDRNYNTIYTTPPAYANSGYYDWAPVWHVVPC
ncbi:peptidase inhibitor family I36 protein [Streptomyces sp. NPDC052236]|uniref:peptidase inhibitor family I36 protein n=1 Tax=Streptomyces sp. NPDC052236 TaxID=3365686 RepID=UPI0037D8DADD